MHRDESVDDMLHAALSRDVEQKTQKSTVFSGFFAFLACAMERTGLE